MEPEGHEGLVLSRSKERSTQRDNVYTSAHKDEFLGLDNVVFDEDRSTQ